MVELHVSLQRSPLTAPVLDGDVELPEGTRTSEAETIDGNTRSMLAGEFDVAEMSLATFVVARLDHDVPLVGLPVFTGRRFPQPLALARRAADFEAADLAGKRVALPQYWMSSSVWHRGVLEGSREVPANAVQWVVTGQERSLAPPLPAGVERANGSPVSLLDDGYVDAALLPKVRSDVAARFPPVYAEPVSEALAYLEATGVFPIMHLVVVRTDVARDAALVQAVMAAFEAAFQRAGPQELLPGRVDTAGHWRYGLEGNNHRSLETFLRYCRTQGLTRETGTLSSLFTGA